MEYFYESNACSAAFSRRNRLASRAVSCDYFLVLTDWPRMFHDLGFFMSYFTPASFSLDVGMRMAKSTMRGCLFAGVSPEPWLSLSERGGHRWSSHSIKHLVINTCGLVQFYCAVEINRLPI